MTINTRSLSFDMKQAIRHMREYGLLKSSRSQRFDTKPVGFRQQIDTKTGNALVARGIFKDCGTHWTFTDEYLAMYPVQPAEPRRVDIGTLAAAAEPDYQHMWVHAEAKNSKKVAELIEAEADNNALLNENMALRAALTMVINAPKHSIGEGRWRVALTREQLDSIYETYNHAASTSAGDSEGGE